MDQPLKRNAAHTHSPRRRAMVKSGGAAHWPAVRRSEYGALAGSQTQPWPNRPVRIVVPYGPAGTADILARILGQQLSKQLGQPFIIENRGGAGTTIGASEVFKSPADGYTIMVVTPTFAIAQYVYPNLPYDGPKDFVPVALLMTTPLHPGRESRDRIQDGGRLHPGSQGQAGPDLVRVERQRQHAASRVRAAQGAGGNRTAAHPVQGRRRGGAVGAVGHDRQLFLRADRIGRAREGRQAGALGASR